MKFVWDMDKDKWNEFTDAIDRGALDVANMVGENLGFCRVGDLCFDIRAWDPDRIAADFGWGFELFVGGVDTQYGYSAEAALKEHPEFKDKYDVPNEMLYPYDEVDYGEFSEEFDTYSLEEFQKAAEPIFEDFIKWRSTKYDKANLLAKANEPLNIW